MEYTKDRKIPISYAQVLHKPSNTADTYKSQYNNENQKNFDKHSQSERITSNCSIVDSIKPCKNSYSSGDKLLTSKYQTFNSSSKMEHHSDKLKARSFAVQNLHPLERKRNRGECYNEVGDDVNSLRLKRNSPEQNESNLLEPAKKKRRKEDENEKKSRGQWTREEHLLFLKGLKECGKGKWKEIAARYVTTRTARQISSHAQKYFIKQKYGTSSTNRSFFDIEEKSSVSFNNTDENDSGIDDGIIDAGNTNGNDDNKDATFNFSNRIDLSNISSEKKQSSANRKNNIQNKPLINAHQNNSSISLPSMKDVVRNCCDDNSYSLSKVPVSSSSSSSSSSSHHSSSLLSSHSSESSAFRPVGKHYFNQIPQQGGHTSPRLCEVIYSSWFEPNSDAGKFRPAIPVAQRHPYPRNIHRPQPVHHPSYNHFPNHHRYQSISHVHHHLQHHYNNSSQIARYTPSTYVNSSPIYSNDHYNPPEQYYPQHLHHCANGTFPQSNSRSHRNPHSHTYPDIPSSGLSYPLSYATKPHSRVYSEPTNHCPPCSENTFRPMIKNQRFIHQQYNY